MNDNQLLCYLVLSLSIDMVICYKALHQIVRQIQDFRYISVKITVWRIIDTIISEGIIL